jgi:hypothetical protein
MAKGKMLSSGVGEKSRGDSYKQRSKNATGGTFTAVKGKYPKPKGPKLGKKAGLERG